MGLAVLNERRIDHTVDLEDDVLWIDEVRFKELRVVGQDVVLLELLPGLVWSDDVVRVDCAFSASVDTPQLDPVLLNFDNKRAAQKAKYLGEMFIAGMPNGPGGPFLDFFQVEKSSGQAKGILRIPLAPLKGATP